MRSFDYYLSIFNCCDDEYDLGIDAEITEEEKAEVYNTIIELRSREKRSEQEEKILRICISIAGYLNISTETGQ